MSLYLAIFKKVWKYKWQGLCIALILALGLSNPCVPKGFGKVEYGQSVVATEIKYLDKVKTEYVEIPVIKYVPTPVQIESIEKKIGAPLPEGPLLTIVDIPILKEGGKGVGYLDPEGKTKFKIYPNKRDWLALGDKRELVFEYEKQFGKEAQDQLRAEISASFLRTSRIEWYGTAGVELDLDTQEARLITGVKAIVDLSRH